MIGESCLKTFSGENTNVRKTNSQVPKKSFSKKSVNFDENIIKKTSKAERETERRSL